MKQFGGTVLFLDRSDINTDEIIPAKYLTEIKKEALRPYLLEDLKIEGFSPEKIAREKPRVIVTRENFGCGSSREHAPWALEVNDITVVIAESFARIFRGNMFNCGMLAIELPEEKINAIFSLSGKAQVQCDIDLADKELIFSAPGVPEQKISFGLSEFDEALVNAGGWLEFADSRY
jgi:3-isopropylmalate/(R)-2-methylmalate dehydratase small subunit